MIYKKRGTLISYRTLALFTCLFFLIAGCGGDGSTGPATNYQLSINALPSEGGTVSPSGGQYEAGETVEISAEPSQGWRFVQWQGDLSSTKNPGHITVDQAKEVTAVFKQSYSEPEKAFPGQTGEITTIKMNGVELTVEKFDTLYVYQGDIIIYPEDINNSKNIKRGMSDLIDRLWYTRWANNTLPYTFSTRISQEFKNLILEGIQMVSDNTNVKFRKKTGGDDSYVVFQFVPEPKDGGVIGSSPVGNRRVLDAQKIRLSPNVEPGVVAHEIMHALGIWHEQSRDDRNTYVDIIWENIPDSLEHNFEKIIYYRPDAQYDYLSIMHYPSFAGQENGIELTKENATILRKGNDEAWIRGQREFLARGDIKKINEIYPEENSDEKQDTKLSYSPSAFDFPAGASNKTLSISNQGTGNLNWELSSEEEWISFDPASGSGKADVTISVKKNTASQQRNANITIISNGGDSEPIAVTQQKAEAQPEPQLAVSPASLSFVATADSSTLSITNSASDTLEWSISSGASWLSFSTDSGTGDTEITVSAQENTSGQKRTAEVSVTSNGGDKAVSVTQSPADQAEPTLSFSPASFDFTAPSGTATLTIKNSGSGTLNWEVSSGSEWLSFDPASGTGNGDVTINYQENTTESQRSGEVTITSNGGNSGPIAVTQQKPTTQNNGNFYLAENEVTVKCPDAEVGESGTIEGITYTKRTQDQITTSNAANSCTSGITNMTRMFDNAVSFNQDIGKWDVSQVKDMDGMFFNAKFFNQNIGKWDVSQVRDMDSMFSEAISFNQDIGDWDVSQVTNIRSIFAGAESFNQDIGSWAVSKVTDMTGLFFHAYSFNQDIGNWDVSRVTNMSSMFVDAESFNKDISRWNIGQVKNMNAMFSGARSFNQDIGSWDVSNVDDMRYMFNEAKSFDQDLSRWCVSNINSEPKDFSSDSPLTEENKPTWGTCGEAASNKFYLADNGITVKCEDAEIGESGTVNGITYTKRSKDQITNSNAATTCTSDIQDMQEMFEDASSFNEDIRSWDVSNVTNMNRMFISASSFNQDIDSWDVNGVTNMSEMFTSAFKFNGNISSWNVSNVKNMSRMFVETTFNRDISSWDVSNVKNMREMFAVTPFNQPIGSWNVSNVRNMRGMFDRASDFNQNINEWDVGRVENMQYMFQGCSYCTINSYSFNKDISNWEVGNVENMNRMFAHNYVFNQPIDSWDVSNVTDMGNMFHRARAFNQVLNSWNVTNVKNMDGMFYEAVSFNGDIGNWDVYNINSISKIFFKARSFNRDIGDWDVSNVTDMSLTFYNASNFNQDLNNWDVSNVTDMNDMFFSAESFNQDIGDWEVSNVKDMRDMFGYAKIFDQDLSGWCVSKITSEPDDFSRKSDLREDNKPVWGTCPE